MRLKLLNMSAYLLTEQYVHIPEKERQYFKTFLTCFITLGFYTLLKQILLMPNVQNIWKHACVSVPSSS